MKLPYIEVFVAVANEGGVARAAARLNIGQPAASRQLQALERELGVRLFDREAGRLRLTSAGEDILERCRQVLGNITSLGERARLLRDGAGTLRIGATPQVIESVLANFLPKFLTRHKAVDVQLVEGGGSSLPQYLERGELHLAIIPPTNGTSNRLLFPMHLVAVVPRSHRLSRPEPIDIAELVNWPLLVLTHAFASRHWLEDACRGAGVAPGIAFESSSPHTLISLAIAGHGIALVPSPVVLPAAKVRGQPIVHKAQSVGAWATIAWHPHRYLPSYVVDFIDSLVAHVGDDYPNKAILECVSSLPRP